MYPTGQIKNHIARSTIKQDIHPYQHKGRRVPLDLTDKVDKEIRHFLDTKQIIKLDKCSDKVFVSPIVITVKLDKSIKLALDSKLRNDAIEKNKYQMQSIDDLMDLLAKYISDNKNKPGNFLFSKKDLKQAYSQSLLHVDDDNAVGFFDNLKKLLDSLKKHDLAPGYNISKCRNFAKEHLFQKARQIFNHKKVKTVLG